MESQVREFAASFLDPSGSQERGRAANALSASSGMAGERLLGRHILIVEDEAMLALELQFAFEDEGAVVVGPASSLASALEIIASGEAIDAAILDVNVAGYEVFPAAHLLQARGTPFIFHTGHASRGELESLFPGALTCIKPTKSEQLILLLSGLTG